MGKAPTRTENKGPTGFVLPTESPNQQGRGSAHGNQPFAVSDNDPYGGVPNTPESDDGYGARNTAAAT